MSGKASIEFYGTAELLRRIEEAGRNGEREIADALVASAEKPKEDMLKVIREHRYTGLTESSFREELKNEDGTIIYKIGFSIKDGGIAALFLNLGLPRKIEPSYFIDRAVEDNIDEIKRVQLEVLKRAFENV